MKKLAPWMKRTLILVVLTGVFALVTCSMIEFPSRYGITSQDFAQCHHLKALELDHCRSQNFSEVVNTISYLRAELVPTPDFCNEIRGYEKTECPSGDFAECYSTIEQTSQAAATQYDRRAYYLLSSSCSKLLYFSSTGVLLKNLMKTKADSWVVEQELIGD